MPTLFLDTASKNHLLALCDRKKTLVTKNLPEKGEGELIPKLEEAMKDVNLTYKDLTHLACAIGPGGFTSLRIGVTAVNTMAYALGLPSAGIHLSDLWKSRVRGVSPFETPRRVTPSDFAEPQRSKIVSRGGHGGAPQGDAGFLWLHSTRRTQIFVKGFGADGTVTPTGIFGLEDAVNLKGSYVGELIPEHQELLTQCTPIPEDELVPLEEMLPGFLAKLSYREQQLRPWYGREG